MESRNHHIVTTWNHGITEAWNHEETELAYIMNLNYIVLKQNKHSIKIPEFKYRI